MACGMEAVAGSMGTKNSNLLAGCSRTDPELRMAPNSDAAAYVSLPCRMSTLKMESGGLQKTPGGRWLRIKCRKRKVTALLRFSYSEMLHVGNDVRRSGLLYCSECE